MLPEEWPIAAPVADPTTPVRAARGGRLDTVRQDVFLPPAARLTEQERALMTAMLHCLVSEIADELRAALPPTWSGANDAGDLELVQLLTTARMLDLPDLVALLLRRADEERISSAARARNGRGEAQLLQGLVSHGDAAVSAAAMALILARGRRRDRFGQCLATFDDLSPPTAIGLTHRIAAALRGPLAAIHGPAAVDHRLADAATETIESHRGDRGIETLTAALVGALDEAGAPLDELILAAASEGEVAFLAAVLAHRASIGNGTALDELLSGEAPRVVALLRAARLPRTIAAGLLAAIGDLLGIDDPGAAIGAFDRFSDAEADAARAWLLTDPVYRSALDGLEGRRG
jgi:hypothetical protein